MKISCWLSAAAVGVALATSGSALAAGPVMKPTPTPTPAAPSPWTAPAATPTPAMMMSSETSTPAVMGSAAPQAVTYRPEGRSLGIGAGWTFPTALGTPNTVSARFRMDDGLTLEPNLQASIGIGSSKVSGGGASVSGSSSAVTLVVGTAVRKPFASRNQVDIVGILTPAITIQSTSDKPAGGTKTTTTAFGIGTGWGLGVEYWPKTHWSLSFNALNPLLNIGSTSTKDSGAGTTTSGTNIFVGGVWNPSVQLMTHIYY